MSRASPPQEEIVNKAELIEALSARVGDKRVASQALDAVLSEIQNTVTKGGKVSITGFGVFEKRARAARMARNPRTGEAVKVKKTSVPAFRPGAGFRELVASGKVPKAAAVKRTATKAAATKTATKAATTRATATKTAGTKATAARSAATKAAATKTAGRKTAATKATVTKATKAAPARKTTAAKAAKATRAATVSTARKTTTAKTTAATKKATPAKKR
jgi:DNA-binding protein HU-beta